MSNSEKEKKVPEQKFSPSSIGAIKRMSSIQVFVLEKRYGGEEHTEKEWEKIITKDGF